MNPMHLNFVGCDHSKAVVIQGLKSRVCIKVNLYIKLFYIGKICVKGVLPYATSSTNVGRWTVSRSELFNWLFTFHKQIQDSNLSVTTMFAVMWKWRHDFSWWHWTSIRGGQRQCWIRRSCRKVLYSFEFSFRQLFFTVASKRRSRTSKTVLNSLKLSKGIVLNFPFDNFCELSAVNAIVWTMDDL